MTPWVGPLKLGLNLSWDSLLPLASIECKIKMFLKMFQLDQSLSNLEGIKKNNYFNFLNVVCFYQMKLSRVLKTESCLLNKRALSTWFKYKSWTKDVELRHWHCQKNWKYWYLIQGILWQFVFLSAVVTISNWQKIL